MSGQGFSMAFDGLAVSQYLDWPFTGFFTLEGRTYGVSPAGIHLLGGPDDDGEPFVVRIRFPATDGGRAGEMRLTTVELGGTVPEGATLTVSYDGEVKGAYEVPDRRGGHHLVHAGREALGRYLQLELVAESRGFELRSLVAEAQELSRRRGR